MKCVRMYARTRHITLYAGTSYRALYSCNCTCWMVVISFLRHSHMHFPYVGEPVLCMLVVRFGSLFSPAGERLFVTRGLQIIFVTPTWLKKPRGTP